MNKIFRIISYYLIIGLPLVITDIIWSTLQSQTAIESYPWIISRLWEILSINVMLWFFMLSIFLVILVAIPAAREKTLLRLANLKERDEREEYIVGKAARQTYISTLSLGILLLFISIFSFSVERAPENQAINGKRTTVSIGLELHRTNEISKNELESTEKLFNSKDFTPSATMMIFTLLCWQLGTYNFVSRRELNKSLS